ncbi:MAG: acylphosphatase [Candidatus Hydrothermarchaeaceae archaeon]
MEAHIKRYNVVIHGRVQDIGFRDLISRMANFLRLRGYVFNDVDGSVKVIVEGAEDTIDSFLEDIRVKTAHIGAEIEELDKRETSHDLDLPPRFVKIATTELEEIGRKLDIGIDILRDLKGGQRELIGGQGESIGLQEKGFETQEKMLKVLEKIEDKL